jgi:hypothetical protein
MPHWLGVAAAAMRLLIRDGKPVTPEAVSDKVGFSLPLPAARAALDQLRALGDYDQIMTRRGTGHGEADPVTAAPSQPDPGRRAR